MRSKTVQPEQGFAIQVGGLPLYFGVHTDQIYLDALD